MVMDNNWRILYDNNHYWKGHYVSRDLLAELQDELEKRAADKGPLHDHGITVEGPDLQVKEVEPDNGFFIDNPGMVRTDRRYREVMLDDGLVFTVPCQDWTSILSVLKLSQERTFPGGQKYHKIHARFWCLVVTPEQRQALIQGMETQLVDAEREGTEDDEAFASGLKRINDKAGRMAVFSPRAEAINARKPGQN